MAHSRGHGEKRSRHEARAIAALLEQPTIGQAAAAAGISERTLRTWMSEPDFHAKLAEARSSLLSAALARLSSLASAAVGVLEKHLDCDEAGPALRAAQLVLQHNVSGAALLGFATQLSRIEKQLGIVTDEHTAASSPSQSDSPGPGGAPAERDNPR
jgi:hypothetical protein